MSRGRKKIRYDTPQRRCIATRCSLSKTQLIRFVLSPENIMTPDIEEKLPGRGYWVKAERWALDLVEQKNLFCRATRLSVETPHHLADLVDRRMCRRIVHLLAMSRKSGKAVAGFEKVKEMLTTGQADIFLQARDGSDNQRRKLTRLASKSHIADCLTKNELGMAFGRPSVVHAALCKGLAVKKMRQELHRLASLRDASIVGQQSTMEPAMS